MIIVLQRWLDMHTKALNGVFLSMKNMKCHSKKDSAQQIDAYIILLSSFLGSLADICNKFSFASCQTLSIVYDYIQPFKITFMFAILSETSCDSHWYLC